MNNFKVCKQLGKIGEALVADNECKNLLSAGMSYTYRFAEYSDDKKGIDVFFESLSEDDEFTMQIKTQSYRTLKFGSFLIELYSNVEKNVLGWLHNTEADVCKYCWLDPSNSKIARLFTLDLKKVKELFTSGKLYYTGIKFIETQGNYEYFKSLCIAVPIEYALKTGIAFEDNVWGDVNSI